MNIQLYAGIFFTLILGIAVGVIAFVWIYQAIESAKIRRSMSAQSKLQKCEQGWETKQ